MASEIVSKEIPAFLNLAALAVFMVLAVVVLRTLDFILIPLSIAFLLLYALGIPFALLERLRLSAWLRILIIIVAMAAVLYLLGSLVQLNVEDFVTQLPEFEKKFWAYSGKLFGVLGISKEEAQIAFSASLEKMQMSNLASVGFAVQKVGGFFFHFLGNVFWVMLFLLFILAEKQSFEARLKKALGEAKAGPLLELAGRVNEAVRHYLGLKTLVSFITGVTVSLVLWLFGVPFALLWGVLTFLLNFIPNIGSVIATFPPVAITLFHTGSPATTVGVAAILTSIHLVVGNFLEPKLMGRGLNLSPLVVLLALIVWGWMWGIIGMLLAVPLTAAIKIAFEQMEATRPVAVLMSAE